MGRQDFFFRTIFPDMHDKPSDGDNGGTNKKNDPGLLGFKRTSEEQNPLKRLCSFEH